MMLMPSCKEVGENLTEYMEGNLPFHKRMGIWSHLMMCKVCHGLLDSLKALPRIAKDLLGPPPEAAPEAVETLDRVLNALKNSKTP